jgi:hypothetical protein
MGCRNILIALLTLFSQILSTVIDYRHNTIRLQGVMSDEHSILLSV